MSLKFKAALAAIAMGFAGPVLAEYPEKPVTFIVPWPPGDLEDVLTRMIADDFVNGYLFQLAQLSVARAELDGLWVNAPTQATDLTGVSWKP